MYNVHRSTQYNKDLKRIAYNKNLLDEVNKVVNLLAENDNPLPAKYKDHQLKGNYAELRECHIRPDWLLVYKKDKEDLILLLIGTGSHSHLFE
jgi:mRNA interferase YafQ